MLYFNELPLTIFANQFTSVKHPRYFLEYLIIFALLFHDKFKKIQIKKNIKNIAKMLYKNPLFRL